MKHNDLLIELGCEELPAGQLNLLTEHLSKSILSQLKNYGLSFAEAKVQSFATPRRLAILVPELEAMTKEQNLERRGPSKAQGFDAAGHPTKALQGFLQATKASLDEVIEVDTDKGIWLAVKMQKPAQKLQDLIPSILNDAIKALPMKKSMRWGSHTFSFLRPVQWLVVLYGKEVLEVELMGVQADRLTYGHRFMGDKPVKLSQAADYEAKLLKAYVVADPLARKAIIEKEAKALINNHEEVRFNTLNEVVNLVEWPQALKGDFKKEFLQIPKEVLISAMETHQRVFPIIKEGQLTAHFIAITNNPEKDLSAIKRGNEKVVSARLSDAEFFYLSDVKIPLLDHLASLKKISFQEQLGSVYDKVTRVTHLAEYLAEHLKINKAQVQQAAQLCKCDLTTDMVQEFPELQGIMGREYALAQGINAEIAVALEDHYKPKVRDGALPSGQVGAVLAIADKLDTLVGLYGVGEKPTGSGDPYALRRQALGIIAIIVKYHWSIDLINVIRYSWATFSSSGIKLAPVEHELVEFFLERIAQWCLDEQTDISTNVINAIKSRILMDVRNKNRHDLDLLEFFDNARDLNHILIGAEGQELLQLVKRATNIVPDPCKIIDYSHLKEPAELALIKVFESLDKQVHEDKKQKQFLKAYTALLSFKAPLARFFDEVMVMADDPVLKTERLSLLHKIMILFYLLADFSCL